MLETPVVTCPGWATTLHLPTVPYGTAGNRRADSSRAQFRMVRPGPRPEEVDQRSRRLEANALRALSEGRELRGQRFDEMVRGLLTAEIDYPMLGIYAGYLVAARRLVGRKQGEDSACSQTWSDTSMRSRARTTGSSSRHRTSAIPMSPR